MLPAICAVTLLCLLSRTDAIVKTDNSIVLDYLDLPANSQFDGRCTTKCNVYATGYVSGGILLRNIHIKVGAAATSAATVADLVVRATNGATGVKTALEIDTNTNYVITNENAAGSDVTPFYIYISTDNSPVIVVDASKKSSYAADKPVLVMSPYPLMTLHSFDTGKSFG